MEDGAVVQRLDYDVWGNVTLNTSLYGYVANEPFNFIDPSGLNPTQENLASLAGIGSFDTYAALLAVHLAVFSRKLGLPGENRMHVGFVCAAV